MYLQKVKSRKKKIKSFFFGILKVYDKNTRIQIQDPDPDPLVRAEAWIPGSGSTPKCHGSGTLYKMKELVEEVVKKV